MADYDKVKIEKLRESAIFPKIDYTPFFYAFYRSYLSKHSMPDGCMRYAAALSDAFSHGRLIPSLFCWIMHDEFGKRTGATPDGRRAGLPLGDGSGPAQGRETEGPTTSLLASTTWDHTPFIGGIAVNMKFSRSTLGDNAVFLLCSLAKTYLSRGGFEWQVNVVDDAVLRDAVAHPEKYPDLVVRIGGYSDYFTRFSPTMQQEVIARTAHSL